MIHPRARNILARAATVTAAICLVYIAFNPRAASAEAESIEPEQPAGSPWREHIDSELSGRVRIRASASFPEDGTFYELVGADTNIDANAEIRLMSTLYFSDWGYLETHYEAVVSGGETRETFEELKRRFAGFAGGGFLLGETIEDDRRLLDLTKIVSENDSRVVYHRIDRLALTMQPEWGTLRVGRQVITWGNGFLFNPMDLFNPFAPTDIERDYKIGDDMATIQFPVRDAGDLEFLYVPRRDPDDHDIEWDSESSYAGKYHFSIGTTEFDLLGARHFEDFIVGVGGRGYLRDAAWRADATWTFLDDGSRQNGYLSFVANMDYSWVWREKNFYGFAEFYYNGLGENNPADALTNPDLTERIERGELFTLGHAYLTGAVQVELHPLFNVFVTVITNLNDPSGIIQPRANWDFREDAQLTFGFNVAYGEDGTEFGGFDIPGTDLLTTVPDTAFIWLTYYF